MANYKPDSNWANVVHLRISETPVDALLLDAFGNAPPMLAAFASGFGGAVIASAIKALCFAIVAALVAYFVPKSDIILSAKATKQALSEWGMISRIKRRELSAISHTSRVNMEWVGLIKLCHASNTAIGKLVERFEQAAIAKRPFRIYCGMRGPRTSLAVTSMSAPLSFGSVPTDYYDPSATNGVAKPAQ